LSRAYYNEIDPKAAAWLRELIRAGHISAGDVDERSIVDVRPEDLRGYDRCHFFAGIGGWDYALNLAGWDGPVWTGSCPCQPFSAAGKGDEFGDERHLWPAWFRLIRESRPDAIFGEQVSSKDALAWFDHVRSDLEGAGYAVAVLDTCAAGVGAPHIRQRLYFVAESECRPAERQRFDVGATARGLEGEAYERQRLWPDARDGCESVAVADAEHAKRRSLSRSVEDVRDRYDDGRTQAHGIAGACGEICELADTEGIGLGQGRANDARSREGIGAQGAGIGFADDGGSDMGDADESGSQGRSMRSGERAGERAIGASGPVNGFWRDAIWLPCRDGKARAVKPGLEPLVAGVPARVVRLRGYGNAINAEAAREFIEAYAACKSGTGSVGRDA